MVKAIIKKIRDNFSANAHPRLGSMLRNVAILFGGNALSSVVGLVYLAILTRALSLEQFGLYALYGALVTVVGRFTSFQTWQAQIHYGAHAKQSDNKPLIFNILFFGWMLDVVAGLLGFGIAVFLGGFAPQLFGLPDDGLSEVAVAASILIFNWICSPTAFFRLHDRFFPQALYQNISSICPKFQNIIFF
jgi:O-antigen/teichoic acid export membrane protein